VDENRDWRSAADLQAVATLGFRGEALPSIASVSRFRLTTREARTIAGTEIIVNGGKIEIVRDGGEAPGTQVEVRSLFYNLPARRKFLRSESTESRNIEHQLHLQAIGHPQIAFSLLRDDRMLLQLPATVRLSDRIRDLYGAELLQRLVEVSDLASSKIRISGFIGQAGLSRQTRSQQLAFVNGRAIESSLITGAIREGYHTALMKGQYPVTFLFLELEPTAVDVNAHPAKREVRFHDPKGVRETIVRCIQQTLETARAEWQEKFRAPVRPSTDVPAKPAPDLTLRPEVSASQYTHRELPHLGTSASGGVDSMQAPGPEIVGQAHRLPRVSLSLDDEKGKRCACPTIIVRIAEILRRRIVINTDETKGSREKNPATARGNPEARPALLRRSRADNQRSRIRSAL